MKTFTKLMAVALAMVMVLSLVACSGGKMDFSKLMDETVNFASLEGAKKVEAGQKWLQFLGDEANQNTEKAQEWVNKAKPETLEKAKSSMESLLEWGTEALSGGEDGLKKLGLDKLIGGKLPDLGKFKDIIGKVIEMITSKLG